MSRSGGCDPASSGSRWKQRDLLTFRMASLIISILMESVEARDKEDTKIILISCCGEERSVETYRGMKHGQRCRTSWSRQWKLSWEAFRLGGRYKKTRRARESSVQRKKRQKIEKSPGWNEDGRIKKQNKREEREKQPAGHP